MSLVNNSTLQSAISSIVIPESPSDKPDSKTVDEMKFAEQEKELYLESFRQDMKERKSYASKVFWLIVCWLLAVFLLVVVAGLNVRMVIDGWEWSFKLSNSVLITLISTTTANVLGIFVFVVRYLFKPT